MYAQHNRGRECEGHSYARDSGNNNEERTNKPTKLAWLRSWS